MNDGLALPAVLAFSAALSTRSGNFVWYEFVLQDIGLGLAFGLVLGFLAAWLMPRGRGVLAAGIPDHHKSLYVLGVAFATYGITVAEPTGNGFIAVFVCAITLGIRRPDLAHTFEQRAQDVVEIVKLGIFVVFGALLTFGDLFNDGWAAVGIVAFTLLAARPVAIGVALAGTRLDTATQAFMAWFGPKGVATMAFSIFVLGQGVAQGERIFDIAALAVLCSIILHGATDTPGSEWIATRRGEPETRASAP
jgi:NhaP-type Na+/H+ or K+/H+ antiporter